MAKKEDLIKKCQLYKGAEKCPYTLDKGMIWTAERTWVNEMAKTEVSDFMYSALDDYNSANLGTFQMDDGIPVTFKAILFNLYGKYNSGSMNDAAKSFKDWYKKNYQ